MRHVCLPRSVTGGLASSSCALPIRPAQLQNLPKRHEYDYRRALCCHRMPR
jgi:hypothetical protein